MFSILRIKFNLKLRTLQISKNYLQINSLAFNSYLITQSIILQLYHRKIRLFHVVLPSTFPSSEEHDFVALNVLIKCKF